MLSLLFASLVYSQPPVPNKQRPRIGETVKERLVRLYKDHKVVSYKNTRILMYNEVDCVDDKINLIYGGNTYDWKCHGTGIPSATVVNAEHTIPQSTFSKKQPMVTDLFHIYSSPSKLNSMRSNYKFAEIDYDTCSYYCRNNECSKTRPSEETQDEYSCLSGDKKYWMPRKGDKGRVARSVFYFYTMYDGSVSTVGDLNTFKQWNILYPPDAQEKARCDAINQTQGNRNPYIDDPSLVDEVF
ncbi:secreted nuclease [Tritrichomonas foetus]|uniref:Secreted nuclease n=1 Tax=Tritrichomonas foetus TaxID=1144522 RepID=A0A1J4KTP0_9EUKA|nr:secreted nuclease [Tritrichomonas foetus]|eukprot:OHT14264.1 secreted nuclease [Tritrichomonas foetus]